MVSDSSSARNLDHDRFLRICDYRTSGLTYDEIGKREEISRERARQIYRKRYYHTDEPVSDTMDDIDQLTWDLGRDLEE